MSNLMKGKVYGLSVPKAKVATKGQPSRVAPFANSLMNKKKASIFDISDSDSDNSGKFPNPLHVPRSPACPQIPSMYPDPLHVPRSPSCPHIPSMSSDPHHVLRSPECPQIPRMFPDPQHVPIAPADPCTSCQLIRRVAWCIRRYCCIQSTPAKISLPGVLHTGE